MLLGLNFDCICKKNSCPSSLRIGWTLEGVQSPGPALALACTLLLVTLGLIKGCSAPLPCCGVRVFLCNSCFSRSFRITVYSNCLTSYPIWRHHLLDAKCNLALAVFSTLFLFRQFSCCQKELFAFDSIFNYDYSQRPKSELRQNPYKSIPTSHSQTDIFEHLKLECFSSDFGRSTS